MPGQPRRPGFQFLWVLAAIVICVGPVALLLLAALRGVIQHPDWLLLVWPSERRARLLWNSLSLSGSVAVVGMLTGLPAGLAIWRLPTRIKRVLQWLVLIFVPLPPYIHALVWLAAAQGINTVLLPLGLPPISLQGWGGTFWIQWMALLPLAVGITLLALQTVDPATIEVGQLLAPGFSVLGRIVLPSSAPLLLSGTGFLFLLTLIDHSVPGLLGLNTYALDIFAEFSATNQPARAFLLAVPGLVVSLLVLLGVQSGIRRIAQPGAQPGAGSGSQSGNWSRRSILHFPLPGWFLVLEQLAVALVTLQIIVPLATLVGEVGSVDRFKQSLFAARSEINYTLWLSLAAALLCLILGWLTGSGLSQSRRQSAVVWWLVTLPLAVPAPLIGIALIMAINHPPWSLVYASAAMPVLAAVSRFLPFATILMAAQINRTDPLLLDAAQIACANPIRRLVKIQLPLLAPGFLAAAILIFSLTLSELGATLLVIPPGRATLTLRIYNYLHYGASAEVAGLGLMLVGVLVLAFLLLVLGYSLWLRLRRVE
ncbi:MAG TPA: ABC transporter permease subunit [Anaerolineaceae bacterium]|nr:ABC transporter permease subunit [Anaerolineaceae bacterium]